MLVSSGAKKVVKDGEEKRMGRREGRKGRREGWRVGERKEGEWRMGRGSRGLIKDITERSWCLGNWSTKSKHAI